MYLRNNSSKDETENLVGTWSILTEAWEAGNLNLAHLNGYNSTNVRN